MNSCATALSPSERSTRQFHLLCLYAILGAFAFAFNSVWLGPILDQLTACREQLTWGLATAPAVAWAALLAASLAVCYLLSLVLLAERSRAGRMPRRQVTLLGALALVASLYAVLYVTVPQLPLSWWSERIVDGLHADTPVWLAKALVWGGAAAAQSAALYLGGVATLVLLVSTAAAPKQIEL